MKSLEFLEWFPIALPFLISIGVFAYLFIRAYKAEGGGGN
jgi:hypothetical protein